MHRRAFFAAFAATVAFDAMRRSGALAAAPSSLDRWAQDLADLNRDLAAEKIGLLTWQDGIARLNAGVEIAELRRYLDFDRLTSAMAFPSKLAETADPHLPAHIDVAGIARPWFVRFFGLRRGGAIIPHVHNNMVSAHLVVDGEFHARTFDRMIDLPDPAKGDAVLLKGSRGAGLERVLQALAGHEAAHRPLDERVAHGALAEPGSAGLIEGLGLQNEGARRGAGHERLGRHVGR